MSIDPRMSSSLLWDARPPRIHVLSDVHLETGPYQFPTDVEFDILIAAGDIGPIERAVPWLAGLGKPVVYVLGNHEYWNRDISQAAWDARQLARGTQVHVLERDSAIIDGVRFLGATLWTNFGRWDADLVRAALDQVQDYRYISTAPWYRQADRTEALRLATTLPQLPMDVEAEEGFFSPAVAYSIHQDTVGWLERQLSEPFSGHTIVVTHHAPSVACLAQFGVDAELLNPANWSQMKHHREMVRVASYASSLEPLLARYRDEIAAWVHGHLHMHADLLVQGVRVVSNARGYAIHRTQDSKLREKGGGVERNRLEPDGGEYLGDARDFDRGFVVDLAAGFEVPLQQVVAECIEELKELIDDCKKLLPYVDCEQDVPRYAVRRAFAENIRSSEVMLDRVISGSAATIDERIGSVLGKLVLPANLPTLDTLDGDSGASQVEEAYARALTLLQSWRDWCSSLPFAASVELSRWCQAALLSVEYLRGRGIYAMVVSPTWRAAFDLGALREIALLANEQFMWADIARLDSHLAENGLIGFIPTWASSDAMEPTEERRLLSPRDLKAALEEPISRKICDGLTCDT